MSGVPEPARPGWGRQLASVVLILAGGGWSAAVAVMAFAGVGLSAETYRPGEHRFPWGVLIFGFFWLLPGVIAMIAGVSMIRRMYPAPPRDSGHD